MHNENVLSILQGKRGKEPDVAEFISAIAAGNNAQLMVIASASIAGSTTLALVAAAHQTGGRVIYILPDSKGLDASKNVVGHYVNSIEFVIGDAKGLLLDDCKGADFVLIDCDIDDHNGVFLAALKGTKPNGALIVGYNAFHKGSWQSEFNTHFLPIGEGLLVTRTRIASKKVDNGQRKSHWIAKVNKWTGEEHVFRITHHDERYSVQA